MEEVSGPVTITNASAESLEGMLTGEASEVYRPLSSFTSSRLADQTPSAAKRRCAAGCQLRRAQTLALR